jgi:hypothetical protein
MKITDDDLYYLAYGFAHDANLAIENDNDQATNVSLALLTFVKFIIDGDNPEITKRIKYIKNKAGSLPEIERVVKECFDFYLEPNQSMEEAS